MGSIVTIGGGSFSAGDLIRIDKRAYELSGKEHPTLLFIPTASSDGEENEYDSYFSSLGYRIEKLLLIKDPPTPEAARDAVMSADVVFAGGGDAILLMDVWKKFGLDDAVREAFHAKNTVFTGISAGSICWYELGHTDSLSYYSDNWDYYRMHGCGLVPAIHSPHFCHDRRVSIEKWMKRETLPAVCLEDCSALEYSEGKYRVITGRDTARAHIYRNDGKDGFTCRILADGDEVIL